MKKIYWIIGIGIVVLTIVIITSVLKGSHPLEVTTEKAIKRTITETVSASGKIQPETELKITSDVSGEIIELLVKEGEQIKKGQLLCRIEPDIYESTIERVNASVNNSKANLQTTKAQLDQAKASLANAEATYNRSKKLMDQNAISQQEFETAKAQFETAKANVAGMIETIKAAEYTVKSMEASLREANSNLDKTLIYAPVDGTVSKLNVEKGERVVGVTGLQGTEILRLANLNEMEVSIEVNENDIIRVHKNDSALIEVDAYTGKKMKGIVTEIANSANTVGTSIDQVTNFIVKIRVLRESYTSLITNENPIPFRPGMSASVDIQTKRVSNVISVPIQAITTRTKKDSTNSVKQDGGEEMVVKSAKEETNKTKEEEIKECVFILDKGAVEMVYVKTGVQDNDYIEVTTGLQEGQEVISGPYGAVSKTLKKGMPVKVVAKDQLFNKN